MNKHIYIDAHTAEKCGEAPETISPVSATARRAPHPPNSSASADALSSVVPLNVMEIWWHLRLLKHEQDISFKTTTRKQYSCANTRKKEALQNIGALSNQKPKSVITQLLARCQSHSGRRALRRGRTSEEGSVWGEGPGQPELFAQHDAEEPLR